MVVWWGGGSRGDGRRLIRNRVCRWCCQDSRPPYPVACWTPASSLAPQTHHLPPRNCHPCCTLVSVNITPPRQWSTTLKLPHAISHPVPSNLLSPTSFPLLSLLQCRVPLPRLSSLLPLAWAQQSPRYTRWIFMGNRPHLFKTLLRLSVACWIKTKFSDPKLSKRNRLWATQVVWLFLVATFLKVKKKQVKLIININMWFNM